MFEGDFADKCGKNIPLNFPKEVSKKYEYRNIVFFNFTISGHTEFPHLEKEGQSTGRKGNSKGKSHPWKRRRGLGEAEICCKINMKKTRFSVSYMNTLHISWGTTQIVAIAWFQWALQGSKTQSLINTVSAIQVNSAQL